MEVALCGYNVLIDDEDYEKVVRYSWYVKKSDIKKGLVYFRHGLTGETIALHRYIFGNIKPGHVLDHANGNTLDNRKSNLRECTISENNRNRKNNANKLGYKCILFDKRCKNRPYGAKIQINKKTIYLGQFATKEEAYAAYCEASRKYHGEFGRVE